MLCCRAPLTYMVKTMSSYPSDFRDETLRGLSGLALARAGVQPRIIQSAAPGRQLSPDDPVREAAVPAARSAPDDPVRGVRSYFIG